jgi:hypothetical protein
MDIGYSSSNLALIRILYLLAFLSLRPVLCTHDTEFSKLK